MRCPLDHTDQVPYDQPALMQSRPDADSPSTRRSRSAGSNRSRALERSTRYRRSYSFAAFKAPACTVCQNTWLAPFGTTPITGLRRIGIRTTRQQQPPRPKSDSAWYGYRYGIGIVREDRRTLHSRAHGTGPRVRTRLCRSAMSTGRSSRSRNCPHRGAPLAHGALHHHTIVCPWHAWEFDCRTGSAIAPTLRPRP